MHGVCLENVERYGIRDLPGPTTLIEPISLLGKILPRIPYINAGMMRELTTGYDGMCYSRDGMLDLITLIDFAAAGCNVYAHVRTFTRLRDDCRMIRRSCVLEEHMAGTSGRAVCS